MNSDLTILKKPNDKKVKEDISQKWTAAQEELLAEWSEKATCFRWLHSRSEKSYRIKNYSFTIPVIILSTLTGTANFAMDSFVPDKQKQIAMACVGAVNIFAGILSTLQNFLRYAELMESHRSCEVQWSKFGRNIAVELALDPIRRKPANDFLQVCRAEYDRLIEQSPTIDDPILKLFKTNFKDTDIIKPDICNGLNKCKIFTPSEEEKKADAVATAGMKIMDINHHRKSKQWAPVEVRLDLPTKINTNFKQVNNDSKKELDSLLNIGKVSSFKNNIDMDKNENNDNPLEIIHEILKNNNSDKDDIEKGLNKDEIKLEHDSVEEDQEPEPEPDPGSGHEDGTDESSEESKLKKEFLAGIEDLNKK